MSASWLRSLPPDLLAILLGLGMVAVVLAPIVLIVRGLARWRGWQLGTFRIHAGVLLVAVATAVGVVLLVAERPPSLVFGACLAIGLAISLLDRWRRRRSSLWRAIRRMNSGDHAGATAELHARIDRQRRALSLPAAGTNHQPEASSASARPATLAATSDERNPFAPPESSSASAGERTGLANDLNTLGVVESNRGHWAEALLAYDEAAALVLDGPIAPILRGNRGYVLIELGRADEGLPLLRQAITDLAPGDRWVRAQFLTALADKLLGLNQPGEVADLLDHARREGRRERVYPRSGKRAWLKRLDELGDRLAQVGSARGAAAESRAALDATADPQ